jgi:dimeric dUTPase (all-alpha-NTP-PPase superfamily)
MPPCFKRTFSLSSYLLSYAVVRIEIIFVLIDWQIHGQCFTYNSIKRNIPKKKRRLTYTACCHFVWISLLLSIQVDDTLSKTASDEGNNCCGCFFVSVMLSSFGIYVLPFFILVFFSFFLLIYFLQFIVYRLARHRKRARL